ncbi:MAG: hypothetical protein AB2989_07040 [Candidatus Symbiodolus clandestinus]
MMIRHITVAILLANLITSCALRNVDRLPVGKLNSASACSAATEQRLHLQYNQKNIDWLYPAAVQGNVFAQYTLGIKHANGKDETVIQDDKAAAEWLVKAAKRGHAHACTGWAVFYR